ncbi:uncharacterized protein CIMG_11021 [Coccidioides immitis RS]|uniref:Uncharacterized protein n=1 Tax=Coccidioides immitis (strain RS) TaxID=246410 RepID=A0A0D8JRH1_COCIM|nr:uncharacterized protein CIMG_11021 [Coccidioides immitis RS]KJF59945.1 hypothetical protein CIMG_11021 [Coccidioides immitis RS]
MSRRSAQPSKATFSSQQVIVESAVEFLPQNLAFEDAGIICCVNHIRDDKPERYPLGDCGCLLSSDNFHPDTGASPSISHAKASDDNFLSPDEVTASGQAAGHSVSHICKAMKTNLISPLGSIMWLLKVFCQGKCGIAICHALHAASRPPDSV